MKTSFDPNDARIKSGMSVGSAIITDMVQDVIVVPSSAVKTKNNSSYVEIFNTPLVSPVAGTLGSPSTVLPKQQTVTIGISDDISTEILAGLKEGDIIVTKTIVGTTTKNTTTPSILNSMTKNAKTSSNRGGPPGM